MYFKVLPAALKDLPWNGHKFSPVQPLVSDFRSVPLSQDIFCSPNLSMKRAESHSKPLIFSSAGLQTHFDVSKSVFLHRGQPCLEATLKLVTTTFKEVMSKSPTYNVSLIYRWKNNQLYWATTSQFSFQGTVWTGILLVRLRSWIRKNEPEYWCAFLVGPKSFLF